MLVGLLDHQFLGLGQLVIGRDQPRFPFQIGALDREPRRMAFEQAARLGDVDQVGKRRRNDREAALAFGFHQPVGREPRERLAQRVDADIVALAQRVELELHAGQQLAAQNVRAQAAVGRIRDAGRSVLASMRLLRPIGARMNHMRRSVSPGAYQQEFARACGHSKQVLSVDMFAIISYDF